MDTDANVRELVELIFGKKSTLPEEMATHSSIPSDMPNEDFMQRLTNVLKYRLVFVLYRWEKYFDSLFLKMLHSHWHYVSYVMRACLYENICNENIFDSFISVCLVILHLGDETFLKVGVDIRDLNPDIFMVFYRKEMKRPFHMRKEFNRLIEYISDHKYLKWLNDSTASALEERHLENMRKDLDNYRASEHLFDDKMSVMQAAEASLAQDVLSTTSVKLPDLLSDYELVQRLVDYRKTEKANEAEKVETALTMETLHGEASLNSDSNTDLREPLEDAAWHENIIQAVTRHNHSKNSGKEIVNSQIFEEASGILENLESKIKSLIEVLNEYNE